MSHYSLVLITLIIFSCTTKLENEPANELPVQTIAGSYTDNPNIETGYLEKKIINGEISCTGHIELPPQFHYSVHSKLPGYIRYVRYIEGDRVRKGDHLFNIENIELIPKQRELLELKAKLKLASQNYDRKSNLIENNATSRAEYDQSKANLELTKASYAGLLAELKLMGVNINALENESKFQSLFPVYATANGHVSHINTHMGKYVNPGIPLMDIVDRSHPHLELSIFNKDAVHIKKDQKVHFNIPGRLENFIAKVERINPALNEENSTLNVHCHIENITDFEILKLGTFVNATLEIPGKEVICAPEEAIVKEAGQYYVYKIVDGEPIKTRISIGSKTGTQVELMEVNEAILNSEIVIKGAYYLE